jgi:putative PIG3 family NAD(P)H quinone oxidoreductase
VRAITIPEFGQASVLTFAEIEKLSPGAGEVLIQVAATAVNRGDLLQRQGFYPPPQGASPIPGLELSGLIVELGEGVEDWNIGDFACAIVTGGGYAEFALVPVGALMRIPAGIDVISAAALPEAACTAWSNLFMLGGLRAGERVLIHGGASGIGTLAIQLARWIDAEVITTASASKHDVCTFLGANKCIDYRTEDFANEVSDVNVILDVIGAQYLAKNMQVLAPNGRLIVIGLQGGRKTEIDLGQLLAKRISLIGTTIRGRSLIERNAITASTLAHVWPLIDRGEIKPVVDQYLSWDDVIKAHEVLEDHRNIGKVVMIVDSSFAE